MLIGQITALVCGGGADDGHVGHDGGEIKPVTAVEVFFAHHGMTRGGFIHRATLLIRIDKSANAHLCQHTRATRRRVSVHIKQDTAWDVVGLNLVINHHAPDGRHWQRRWATRI